MGDLGPFARRGVGVSCRVGRPGRLRRPGPARHHASEGRRPGVPDDARDEGGSLQRRGCPESPDARQQAVAPRADPLGRDRGGQPLSVRPLRASALRRMADHRPRWPAEHLKIGDPEDTQRGREIAHPGLIEARGAGITGILRASAEISPDAKRGWDGAAASHFDFDGAGVGSWLRRGRVEGSQHGDAELPWGTGLADGVSRSVHETARRNRAGFRTPWRFRRAALSHEDTAAELAIGPTEVEGTPLGHECHRVRRGVVIGGLQCHTPRNHLPDRSHLRQEVVIRLQTLRDDGVVLHVGCLRGIHRFAEGQLDPLGCAIRGDNGGRIGRIGSHDGQEEVWDRDAVRLRGDRIDDPHREFDLHKARIRCTRDDRNRERGEALPRGEGDRLIDRADVHTDVRGLRIGRDLDVQEREILG